jgi:hypothetical protein
VTGLGDQARAVFVADRPDPAVVTASDDPFPAAFLIVRSGNAGIRVIYGITAAGAASGRPAGIAQLTGMISVARDILAALVRHAGVSSYPPISLEPHYTGRPDPCRVITAATQARYAPGTVVIPLP